MPMCSVSEKDGYYLWGSLNFPILDMSIVTFLEQVGWKIEDYKKGGLCSGFDIVKISGR